MADVKKPEPDAIARKLFILTMCGACAFATLVMVMTHLVSSEPAHEGPKTSALVRLVPLE
jgi:hypothetical protein